MILIYAFSNQWGTNISHRTLLELQKLIIRDDVVFQLIKFHPRQFYRKYIANNQYDLIIGLGDGSDKTHRIRIETQARNNYGNDTIYPFSPILLDLNLPPVDIYDARDFVISSNMGTYNCNWLAYSTQLHLNQKSPATFHLFLHLPRKENAALLGGLIQRLISDNHVFQVNPVQLDILNG